MWLSSEMHIHPRCPTQVNVYLKVADILRPKEGDQPHAQDDRGMAKPARDKLDVKLTARTSDEYVTSLRRVLDWASNDAKLWRCAEALCFSASATCTHCVSSSRLAVHIDYTADSDSITAHRSQDSEPCSNYALVAACKKAEKMFNANERVADRSKPSLTSMHLAYVCFKVCGWPLPSLCYPLPSVLPSFSAFAAIHATPHSRYPCACLVLAHRRTGAPQAVLPG